MRYLKTLIFALLPVAMLALAGCGSSGTTTTDPFSKATGNTGNTNTGGNTGANNGGFNNFSTAAGKVRITLTTDKAAVDVNNGQVLAIAKVVVGEAPAANVPVTFKVLAPTNLATIEQAVVNTDSNGMAVTRITTGDTPSTTNVLLSASIPVGSDTVGTNASFQLVRGGGVIMFSSNAGITPGGQSNLLEASTKTVPPNSGIWVFLQLIPFKVTDSNGNPRVGVPVTLSLFSLTTRDPNEGVIVDFLVDQNAKQETIITDSAGQGIFSTAVYMRSPGVDGANVVNVVYKAQTGDTPPVTAYIGNTYTLEAKAPDTKAAQ